MLINPIKHFFKNILSVVFVLSLLVTNVQAMVIKTPISISTLIETNFLRDNNKQYLLITLDKNNIDITKSMVQNFQDIALDLDFTIHSELYNLDSIIANLDYKQFQTLKGMRKIANIRAYKELKPAFNEIQPEIKTAVSNTVFDPNVIPSYHQAIGITNYNSTFRMSGSGQTIAFIDTGTDFGYRELSGKMVAEACFSNIVNALSGHSSSLCPNGQSTQIGAGASTPCLDLRECQHGSIVAGIAIGRKTLTNHAGIAPNARAISINIFHTTTDPDICGINVAKCLITSNFAYLKALDHIMTLHRTIPVLAVNMSLGSPTTRPDDCDDSDTETFHNLILRGVAIIISAGNEGDKTQMSDPACQSRVLSVASYNENTKTISSFSNISPKTNYLAPGNYVRSLGYRSSGTSMSAPIVAGAFALMREAGSISVLTTQKILMDTGTIFPTQKAKLIDINKALGVIRLRNTI